MRLAMRWDCSVRTNRRLLVYRSRIPFLEPADDDYQPLSAESTAPLKSVREPITYGVCQARLGSLRALREVRLGDQFVLHPREFEDPGVGSRYRIFVIKPEIRVYYGGGFQERSLERCRDHIRLSAIRSRGSLPTAFRSRARRAINGQYQPGLTRDGLLQPAIQRWSRHSFRRAGEWDTDIDTSADGACETRSRRDEESMLFHRRRIATKISSTTPVGPSGSGGTAPSSSSLVLTMNEHCCVLAPRIQGRLRSERWYQYGCYVPRTGGTAS